MSLSTAELLAENERLKRELQAAQRDGCRQPAAIERRVWETLADGVVTFRADGAHAGEIVSANPAAAALWGYTDDELVGRRVQDLVAPTVSGGFAARMAALRTHGAVDVEGEIVRKEGSTAPVWFHASIVEPQGERLVVAVMRDLSERRRAEAALRASEARHRTIFERAGDAIIVVRLGDRGPVIVDANGAMASLHGYTLDELRGMPVATIVAPESIESAKEQLAQVMAGASFEGDATHVHRDGHRIAMELHATRVELDDGPAIVAFFRDVTERLRIEGALRASEARYRALFEGAGDALAVAFVVDGAPILLDANAAMAALYGYSLDELRGMNMLGLIAEGERANARMTIDRATRGTVPTRRSVHVRRDGTRFHVDVSTAPVEVDGRLALLARFHDMTDELRMVEAVRASETRYRTLFDNAPQAILVVAIEQERPWRVVAANDAAAALTGYATDVLVGLDIRDLQEPRPGAATAPWAQALFEAGRAEGEDVLVQRGGAHLAVHARVTLTEVDGRSVALVFLQDLTELRRVEMHLRELIEQAPDGILLAGPDGRFTDANAAACALFGYAREELLGMTAAQLLTAEDASMLRAALAGALAPGYVHFATWTVVRKDGRRVETETRAKLLADGTRQAIVRDVTERRRLDRERAAALEALRASEDRYRTMFEGSDEAILVYAVEGERLGRVVAANRACATLSGYTAEELRHHTLLELTDVESHAGLAERLARLLADGHASGTTTMVRKDGARVPLSLHTSLVELGGERVALSSGRDMTIEQKTADALREAKETAEHANRAKSAFLANMSHEIRTPMNAVLGYAELLQRDPTLSEEQRRYLSTITRSGDHLLEMINGVLEMSKIEAGFREVHRAPVALPALFDDLGRMFALRAEGQGIDFRVRVDRSVPLRAVADEGKLRQVIVNLLSNALRLTRRGHVEARAVVEASAEGGWRELVVEVEDTGPGISEADLARLFQPFEQARAGARAGGGTGLGLALSRELARLMGGEITVRSRVGEGSVFRVTTPLESVDEAESIGPASPLASGARVLGLARVGPPPRVLVADDSDDGRQWLCTLLRKVGFEVEEAADGARALELSEAWAPDAVLMDLHMPVLDGLGAIRAIRARGGAKRPVIVVVTAAAFEETRSAVFAAGADAWLRKPCREGEIFDALGRHLSLAFVHERTAEHAAPEDAGSGATALPAELSGPIVRAARIADFDALVGLIAALPQSCTAARLTLHRLADAFAYDRIVALLEGETAVRAPD